ncbi:MULTISPECIES: hypothetical protein [Erwiniaceae]|uniref:hypothetical protein n=1 Tax=Erwiniaceae TaxID=1903409 RepID=UPI000ABD3EA8|nr:MULTISPECIES: hypothetical protein [Erwiniaceae]MBK0090441.1 hypothetical protein [Erwinia sp. S59]
MEARDDKLIAIIGLLSACLIGVVFLFTMTWLTDVRHPADPTLDVQTCPPKVHPTQNS